MINAHLSGLRYWMFYWPILSAIVGIGTILFFITLVCTLSYLHLENEENVDEDCAFYDKSEIEDDNELKTNNDCKLFYNMSNSLVQFLYKDYKKSSKVSNTSRKTDEEKADEEKKDEEKNGEKEKSIIGGPSYIQDLSTSTTESSSSDVIE